MLDELFQLSRNFLRNNNLGYHRYLLAKDPFKHRCAILLGQRGIGKTTVLVQYLHSCVDNALSNSRVLYLPADHFKVGETSLYAIAEEFSNFNGEIMCIDEIHKYQNWSEEIKSIYDSFPKLKVIASGSSALVIRKGSHDLSRRALVVKMVGMSLREHIELLLGVTLEKYSFETILRDHEQCADKIIKIVEKQGEKILSVFKEYLKSGYYPFSFGMTDVEQSHVLIEQGIHAAIESDLLAVHASLTGDSVRRIKKLLSLLASSVPFTPDMRKLKVALDIGDERTLKLYLSYLEDAGIISMLAKAGGKMRSMGKPEKIYLNNPNQQFALQGMSAGTNIGSLRETFFVNMLQSIHEVLVSDNGDFLIDGKCTIEVGGKSKKFRQIQQIPDSYLVLDEIERGIGKKIPLWLFGFLY